MSMGNYTVITDDIKTELKPMMQDESDIIEFVGLLEKVRNLGNLSVDRRQCVLSDLIFWKSQIDNLKKQTEIALKKIEAINYKKVYDKLKLISRPTESQITAEMNALEKSPAQINHEERILLCEKWATILNDLYYISQTSHKILGNG